jgi:asparagine synthase (glutamine-hydrolysing)
MSVQFGVWNQDGRPVACDLVDAANSILAPYAPDACGSHQENGIRIVYRTLHTTKESRCENQPHRTESGAVLTWDGRLDNRDELVAECRNILPSNATDVAIAAAAYEKWGNRCLARLIGDWALSIWSPQARSLILAKDPIGTRHLYYAFDSNQVRWSTVLDPLVLLAEKRFALDEEYIAGWFSFFPETHLTPYVGIHSVPPSSFVLVRSGVHAVSKYWDFDRCKTIRYRSDAEYEEHFRAVFLESVRRRLRSDRPVLAELSGGMDSSSIVCVADTITSSGGTETRRLDTISYYDDSEPNWNERAYFSKVEEKRGRQGWHIDVASREFFRAACGRGHRFTSTPSAESLASKGAGQFSDCMVTQGYRVVLSGIGGDEALGGVPSYTGELADLLVTAQFGTFARQWKLWALHRRKTVWRLLAETIRGFFPPWFLGVPHDRRPPSWLDPEFRRKQRAALCGYLRRQRVFGPLPTFQENLSTLGALRRQLECSALPSRPPYERRYPFLDRTLLEFLYAIPSTQLVRPGQRRSLMRRALLGIVPNEVLNRKRKAFVARAPLTAICTEFSTLLELTQNSISSSLGIVDGAAFADVLRKGRNGQQVPLIPVMRTVAVECWLRALRDSNVFTPVASETPEDNRETTAFHDRTFRMARDRAVQNTAAQDKNR